MTFGESVDSYCTGGLTHHRPGGGNCGSSCAPRNKKGQLRTEELWLFLCDRSHLYRWYPLAMRASAGMETLCSVKMLLLKLWFQATDGSIAQEPMRMQPESKWASRLWRHSRWEMPQGVCEEHRGGFLLSRYSMWKKVLWRREYYTHFSISYASRRWEDAQKKLFSTK